MRNGLRMAFFLMMTLLLLCMGCTALADDVYTVDASGVTSCETDRSYLRVECPVSGEQNVTMTIRTENGGLYYQRSYGMNSGFFRSEAVYLRLDGDQTAYDVTLQLGETVYVFRVRRIMARLTDSAVTAHGLSLTDLSGRASNKYAVVVDVDALEGSTLTVPMVGSGMQLGYVNLTVEEGVMEVSAFLTVDGGIDKATVYVARDAVTARTLGTSRFTGLKTRLNRAIDLQDTPYAAVLVQLTVSYDPMTAQAWQPDSFYLEQQQRLWEWMQLTTANEAVG